VFCSNLERKCSENCLNFKTKFHSRDKGNPCAGLKRPAGGTLFRPGLWTGGKNKFNKVSTLSFPCFVFLLLLSFLLRSQVSGNVTLSVLNVGMTQYLAVPQPRRPRSTFHRCDNLKSQIIMMGSGLVVFFVDQQSAEATPACYSMHMMTRRPRYLWFFHSI
jgi:hypothetical protein